MSDSPSFRVRPLIPESAVSDAELADLLDVVDTGRLSRPSAELLTQWCGFDDIRRRIVATKIVMFRVTDSDGVAVEPALAAEEQFMFDELELAAGPHEVEVATRLLCIRERCILVRTFKRFLTELVTPN